MPVCSKIYTAWVLGKTMLLYQIVIPGATNGPFGTLFLGSTSGSIWAMGSKERVYLYLKCDCWSPDSVEITMETGEYQVSKVQYGILKLLQSVLYVLNSNKVACC
jgi:hypothetical protein